MITVIKASGESEPFSEEKLKNSIKRAGVSETLEEKALEHIKSKLHDGIKTSEIYHHITEFLEKEAGPFAKTKYSLKRAIMDFGPTGYPFEDFVSEILKTYGYETSVRQIVKGKCITHEIDVIAQKGSDKIMIEAKFHNLPGNKTHSHVPMYTKARFDDTKDQNGFTAVWLVTNTNTSIDALSYAQCVGMHLVSWSYPKNESLRDMVEKSNLTPITALSSLSHAQKQQLLSKNFALAKDICKDTSFLDILNLSNEQKQKVLEEAAFVCNLPTPKL